MHFKYKKILFIFSHRCEILFNHALENDSISSFRKNNSVRETPTMSNLETEWIPLLKTIPGEQVPNHAQEVIYQTFMSLFAPNNNSNMSSTRIEWVSQYRLIIQVLSISKVHVLVWQWLKYLIRLTQTLYKKFTEYYIYI